MDTNRPIAIVEKYNTSSTNKSIETIKAIDSNKAIDSFISWASKLKLDTFEIYSTDINFKVVFTIYCRGCTNNLHYIIISSILNNKIQINKSYKLEHKLKEIDIDNMGDIISFFIRICKGDIIYLKDESIVNLIEFQMKRIAVEIE